MSILCLFYAYFCSADFLSDPFDFRLQKPDKEVAPIMHEVLLEMFSSLVLKYANNRNCFGTYTYGVKGCS